METNVDIETERVWWVRVVSSVLREEERGANVVYVVKVTGENYDNSSGHRKTAKK